MASIGRTDAFVVELEDLLSDLAKIVARVQDHRQDAIVQPPGNERRHLLDTAERLIGERRARYRHFSSDLFHERAWDMLLELYVATGRDVDNCVKDMVRASDGPPTTAVRWIDHLEKIGLVVRSDDPSDRRRVLVAITPDGIHAMDAYLHDILSPSSSRS